VSNIKVTHAKLLHDAVSKKLLKLINVYAKIEGTKKFFRNEANRVELISTTASLF